MTAGKTAPTDNQPVIQALSTHAPASNRRQAGFPWVKRHRHTKQQQASEPSRFRGADITGSMSTKADPKTRSFPQVLCAGRTRRRIFQRQYHRGYALCRFDRSRHSGTSPPQVFGPASVGLSFQGICHERTRTDRWRHAGRPWHQHRCEIQDQKFDYQPAEKATRFEPGCEEKFTINSVAMQIRAGTWIDLSSAEYDDLEMIQHILDAREKCRRDAELDRYFNRSAA